jgi:hypothetical protein
MSTQAGTIGSGTTRGVALRDWLMALVAAVAVAALVMAALALRSSRVQPLPAPHAAARAGQERSIVTGTGPDLAIVADGYIAARLHADRAPVTGTGPDLVEIAWASRIANAAPVTGTGPDLAVVAGRR